MNSFVFKIKELIWKLFQKEEFSADNLVCYIKSGETLPPPFSDEEEKYYITQAENGSQFAREQLIEHNFELIAQCLINICPDITIHEYSCSFSDNQILF